MDRTIILKIEHAVSERDVMERMLSLLFSHSDEEFTLSELAARAGVSKSTASRALQQLAGAGLVKITDLGVVWRVGINQKSALYVKEKIIRNLSLIYRSNLTEFLNSLFGKPRAIVLFGSFRRGEDRAGSDIDIAVELDFAGGARKVELAKIEGLGERQAQEVLSVQKALGRRLMLTLFDRAHVELGLYREVANGIVLSGFLEVGRGEEGGACAFGRDYG